MTPVAEPDDRHESLFIADFYPALGAHLARQHASGYDAAAGRGQCRHPARIDPVHLLVGGKAVNENDRIAGSLIEKGELDGSVLECWHDSGGLGATNPGPLTLALADNPS